MKNTANRLVSPLMLAALAAGAAAPLAAADVISTTFMTNKASYKRLYSAGNGTATINFGSGGAAYRLLISGTLHRNTLGTYPREACIRIRRLVHLAPNISIVTHEFTAQPFTGTAWDANGNATVTDALVLPVPESGNFNGGFSWCPMFEPGHYDIEFFEQYDDDAADNGPTPDATWTNVSIKFDDTPPSLATPAPLEGTVGVTTRYGVRSNDNLDPGPFTGSQIDPLAQPANATRIKHVRVTGYITAEAFTTATEQAGPNEAGQARLRLRRYESVQLSPGAPSPYSRSDDMTVVVPFATASTGYINMDIPVPTDDDFGKLTRNVPTSEDESYYGIKYFATAYESDDHLQFPTDNFWNGLKVELFSHAQPPNDSEVIDFGTLFANPASSHTVLTRTGTVRPGKVLWFSYTLPEEINGSYLDTYLDIDTEGSDFDTMIACYGGFAGNAGHIQEKDDDDGSGTLSQISLGSDTIIRAPIGNGMPGNGRDGAMGQGRWYIAVVPYVQGTGLDAFGLTDFNASNPDVLSSHNAVVNVRFNCPASCGPADLGRAGGFPGGDGELDNNDFIAFISYFFAHNPLADLGMQGGVPGADGQFDNNDLIVFISKFFQGCTHP